MVISTLLLINKLLQGDSMKKSYGINNCRECKKLMVTKDINSGTDVCNACYAKYEKDFFIIKNYLEKYPKSSKGDINKNLGISLTAISLYMDEGRLILAKGDSEKKIVINQKSGDIGLKISKRFEKDTISVDIKNIDILEKDFSCFIVMGDETLISVSENIKLKNLQVSERARQLRVEIDDSESGKLKGLLIDGNRFIVYLENDDIIIPSEVIYFSDRPATLTIMPNKAISKKQRSPRQVVNKNAVLSKNNINIQIIINDISRTGISFYVKEFIGGKGDKAKIKDKDIVIVDKKNLIGRYFYRAYFE